MNEYYKRILPQYKFGPWYDHYVKSGCGVCHPDFDTTIITGSDARGVKVCTRRQSLPPIQSLATPQIFFPHSVGVHRPETGTGLYNATRKIVYF